MNARLLTLLVGAAGVALGAAATHAADDRSNRASIERVVHDYLLAHPEIIPEALQRLQSQETASAIDTDARALRTPFEGAWAGNPKGDVTLVMFSDYACGYCRASVSDIDRLIAADPRLKVVWREIPVLGPDSEVAARVALAAARQGQARYLAFHHALFAAGRPDAAHLDAAARAAGLDLVRIKVDQGGADIRRELDNDIALAARLKVDGTPAFVVGQQMLNGAVGYDRLAQAIAAARKG